MEPNHVIPPASEAVPQVERRIRPGIWQRAVLSLPTTFGGLGIAGAIVVVNAIGLIR